MRACRWPQIRGSRLGTLAMSGDVSGCHDVEGATGIPWTEAGLLLNILPLAGRPTRQSHWSPVPAARGWQSLPRPTRFFSPLPPERDSLYLLGEGRDAAGPPLP